MCSFLIGFVFLVFTQTALAGWVSCVNDKISECESKENSSYDIDICYDFSEDGDA